MVYGAAVAALYVVLTWLSSLLGLSGGPVQLRFSEALTVLPLVLPGAVPGLFAGCMLANLLTGSAVYDVLFGSLATLLGALGTRYLSHSKWTAPVFPILSNTLILPLLLRYVYSAPGSVLYLTVTVGAGELISCGVLGLLLLSVLKKNAGVLFH